MKEFPVELKEQAKKYLYQLEGVRKTSTEINEAESTIAKYNPQDTSVISESKLVRSLLVLSRSKRQPGRCLMTMEVCEKVIDSHIIPDNILQEMKKSSKTGKFVDDSVVVKMYLFSQPMEGSMSIVEEEFKNNLFLPVFNPSATQALPSVTSLTFPFCLSILWRCLLIHDFEPFWLTFTRWRTYLVSVFRSAPRKEDFANIHISPPEGIYLVVFDESGWLDHKMNIRYSIDWGIHNVGDAVCFIVRLPYFLMIGVLEGKIQNLTSLSNSSCTFRQCKLNSENPSIKELITKLLGATTTRFLEFPDKKLKASSERMKQKGGNTFDANSFDIPTNANYLAKGFSWSSSGFDVPSTAKQLWQTISKFGSDEVLVDCHAALFYYNHMLLLLVHYGEPLNISCSFQRDLKEWKVFPDYHQLKFPLLEPILLSIVNDAELKKFINSYLPLLEK